MLGIFLSFIYSAADQIVPLMVLPFSDEADIDGGYLMFSIWLIQALKLEIRLGGGYDILSP